MSYLIYIIACLLAILPMVMLMTVCGVSWTILLTGLGIAFGLMVWACVVVCIAMWLGRFK